MNDSWWDTVGDQVPPTIKKICIYSFVCMTKPEDFCRLNPTAGAQ